MDQNLMKKELINLRELDENNKLVYLASTLFDTNTTTGQIASEIEESVHDLIWSENKPTEGEYIYFRYLIDKIRDSIDKDAQSFDSLDLDGDL
jgi:hypothetical protein